MINGQGMKRNFSEVLRKIKVNTSVNIQVIND